MYIRVGVAFGGIVLRSQIHVGAIFKSQVYNFTGHIMLWQLTSAILLTFLVGCLIKVFDLFLRQNDEIMICPASESEG